MSLKHFEQTLIASYDTHVGDLPFIAFTGDLVNYGLYRRPQLDAPPRTICSTRDAVGAPPLAGWCIRTVALLRNVRANLPEQPHLSTAHRSSVCVCMLSSDAKCGILVPLVHSGRDGSACAVSTRCQFHLTPARLQGAVVWGGVLNVAQCTRT